MSTHQHARAAQPLPNFIYYGFAYALVFAGAGIGWVIFHYHHPKATILPTGIGPFALLYIFAQAIERFLEPISTGIDKRTNNSSATPNSKARRNKAIFLWGTASFLAALASGGLGIFLLKTVGVKAGGHLVDIFVTGLVVGAGTKPLHDLISNVQKSKEKNETQTAAVAPPVVAQPPGGTRGT